jgi:outer membrane scaffolding protein for murein synthesis (MipA/OmpV family)
VPRRRGAPLLALALTLAFAGGRCVAADIDETVAAKSSEAAAPVGSSRWEGAIGATVSEGPSSAGSDSRKISVTPAFYLRRGRFSISSGSGFITRPQDEVVRGLGIDVVERKDWRISAGLRYDGGRDADPAAGIGEVRNTVRVRLSGRWQIDEHWRLAAGWTVDALGRGGGDIAELRLSHERLLSAWMRWEVGAALAVGGDKYMQAYFGIDEALSAASGLPVYKPGAGLRDLSLGSSLRFDITPRWVGHAGIGVGQLLGPAADSPSTRQTFSYGFSTGLAWRF